MLRNEANEQYLKSVKLGKKCHRSAVLRGDYPYLQVLDDLLGDAIPAGQIELGLVEIPLDMIVGTKAAGRTTAFASNFMPLLDLDTEFGAKWVQLCMAHLSPEGIRDPIRCFEYLGRFYVQEGNKRVSVLKSYGATTISGYVTRVIPNYSQEEEVQAYYEFMQYYRLAGLYQLRFTQPGSCAKLQAALGFDPEHVWTKEERKSFLAQFSRFRDFYFKHGGRDLEATAADALLVWLKIYPYSDLKEMVASELSESVQRIMPDIRLLTKKDPLTIQTEPMEAPGEKGLLSQLLSGKPERLQAAFVFHASPETSVFTRSHELGAKYVEQTMGEAVLVRYYYGVTDDDQGLWTMEKAVAEGAQVIIATEPPLIGLCRKILVKHPNLKVLNCSLSMAYAGVRTYYSRIYEGKFITGAVAAAMAKENTIGYVANYPIYGTPACINAFALGARMINPDVRIQLEWTCTNGSPYTAFAQNGVRVISNRETAAPGEDWDWGTYRRNEDGSMLPLASPCWNWGIFYEKVLNSILNGSWDVLAAREKDRAVGYWWGMDSGVIDVKLSPDLPDGTLKLAKILKRGVMEGSLHPFGFRMVDQSGQLRTVGQEDLTPEEIMHMDYLLDCVDGSIPQWEDLQERSKNLVRILGLYRDQIPPEKEGVLL